MLLFHSIYTPVSNTGFNPIPTSPPPQTSLQRLPEKWQLLSMQCTTTCPVSSGLASYSSPLPPLIHDFKMLPNYITLASVKSSPLTSSVRRWPWPGCAVKLDSTGGMARSWTLISLTKTFTLQRTKTHSHFCGEEREEEAEERRGGGEWLMVTAKLGRVLSRNSHGLELLEKTRFEFTDV